MALTKIPSELSSTTGIVDNSNATAITIDSNENVGIGTSSPEKALHINSGTSNIGVRVESSDATASIEFMDSGTTGTLQSARVGGISDDFFVQTNGSERLRIDSSGQVAIGTSSPSQKLHIDSGEALIKSAYSASGTTNSKMYFASRQSGNWRNSFIGNTGDALTFATGGTGTTHTNATERMRLDSSGNVLVGTTNTAPASSGNVAGSSLLAIGKAEHSRDGGVVLALNRKTSDGTIAEFRKDGSTVGTIDCTNSGDTLRLIASNNYVAVGAGSTGLLMQGGTGSNSNSIRPYNPSNDSSKDNAIGLGKSWARFTDLWAVDDSINTSDFNEKQEIAELSEAEQRVAVACKGLLRKFRWKDAVSKKGDEARIHFGIIAQDLQAAFEAEGLDASRYAMWCSDTWWEQDVEVPAVEAVDAVYETQTDEEGNETQVLVQEAVEAVDAYTRTDTFETAEEAPEGATEKTRLGVRYSELLAFIISAI